MNRFSTRDGFVYSIREDPASALFGAIVATVLIFLWLWFLYSRFGYRGRARLFLSLTSLFPAFCFVNLVIVSLITSPNEVELKNLRKQVNPRIQGMG